MNGIQLQANGKPTEYWQCGKCNRLCRDADDANRCCDWKCDACGKPARDFHLLCDPCQSAKWNADREEKERQAFAKAKPRDDYEGPFMFNERYFDNLTAIIEHCETNDIPAPAYVWVPDLMELSIDAGHVIDWATEEHHEDASDECDHKELQELLDAWCKKQGVVSFSEAWKEYVLVPAEMRVPS